MRGCSYGVLFTTWREDVFPAYAGMFRSRMSNQQHSPSFPRVCGDVPPRLSTLNTAVEFSPRMRGCSHVNEHHFCEVYVFPAYAGMFRVVRHRHRNQHCFPRVCGDVPLQIQVRFVFGAFSPRMRGCSHATRTVVDFTGVFPAYAGMFRFGAWRCTTLGRFPRVCGDVSGGSV